jgi:hypothetical protein
MSSSVYPFAWAASGVDSTDANTPRAITAREQTFRLCIEEGSEGSGAGRHKSRRPRLGVGNATPRRGERVPGTRKRPSRTRLRDISRVSRAQNPDIPLSRRCHFLDVQYHYFRFGVSVGKVNVYKVEALRNRYPLVSRPRQFFVLLTEVNKCLLCALNHSHDARSNHYRTRTETHEFNLLLQPVQ